MTVPSTGDILMLSQKAWRIGRAFAACEKNAPPDLRYVEVEVSGLAKALKLLAEALHAESENAFQSADEDTQAGICIILKSCERTVNDLDSFVDQHQVIRKHRTVGGFAIERAWSDLMLAEYKTVIWTTEGGDLNNLRDLLQVHSSSVTVLMQALQSKSLARLQSVVIPMAERIDSMYNSDGSLDQQLDELHRMVHGLGITPGDYDTPPVPPPKNPARLSNSEEPPQRVQRTVSSDSTNSQSRRQNLKYSLPRIPSEPRTPVNQIIDWDNVSPTSLQPPGTTSPRTFRNRASESSYRDSSLRYSSSSYGSSDAGQSSVGWQSPQLLSKQSHLGRQHSTSTKKTSPPPGSSETRDPRQRADHGHASLLSPPGTASENHHELERKFSQQSGQSRLSPYPASQVGVDHLYRISTTTSQKTAFQKEAFRNSAILCDVRGKAVEYSHRINRDDPRDVEMVPVADACRIAVVRKRITDNETRLVRVVTSIWAFSDDNEARVELRMEDDQMYIPYASYFSPTKVSITVPCELRFHDVVHGVKPPKVAKTSWVNYVFDTPQAAALFQNELMGRTLLATFRTEKTMRIHEGLSKSFTYAEQMCGLETLRVWEDTDTGAIIALIHFSADFRSGYLAFYLNSSTNPIKVKDDGHREVKIKGLRVPIERGASAVAENTESSKGKGKGKERMGSHSSGGATGAASGSVTRSASTKKSKKANDKEKVISGAKIEFATEMEKREFLDLCRVMQGNMIELPELKGVN